MCTTTAFNVHSRCLHIRLSGDPVRVFTFAALSLYGVTTLHGTDVQLQNAIHTHFDESLCMPVRM